LQDSSSAGNLLHKYRAGITTNLDDTTEFGLARYNRNGTLDSTFGAGGKVKTNFGDFVGARAVFSCFLTKANFLLCIVQKERPKYHERTPVLCSNSFGR